MWVRSAAIPPIPAWARVPKVILDRVVATVSAGEEESEAELRAALSRYEATQPVLAHELDNVLHDRLDETARSLGFFLSVCVWMAFEQTFADRLQSVSEEESEAVRATLSLDEELRRDEPDEPVETDDVLAMEQPEVVAFVREHVEAAIDSSDGSIDLDAVDKVYRLVLSGVLALSQAVKAPDQFPTATAEWSA